MAIEPERGLQPAAGWREPNHGHDDLLTKQIAGRSGHHQRGQGSLRGERSEEHTSELQSLMRISYAVFCLKKKKAQKTNRPTHTDRNSQPTKHQHEQTKHYK